MSGQLCMTAGASVIKDRGYFLNLNPCCVPQQIQGSSTIRSTHEFRADMLTAIGSIFQASPVPTAQLRNTIGKHDDVSPLNNGHEAWSCKWLGKPGPDTCSPSIPFHSIFATIPRLGSPNRMETPNLLERRTPCFLRIGLRQTFTGWSVQNQRITQRPGTSSCAYDRKLSGHFHRPREDVSLCDRHESKSDCHPAAASQATNPVNLKSGTIKTTTTRQALLRPADLKHGYSVSKFVG